MYRLFSASSHRSSARRSPGADADPHLFGHRHFAHCPPLNPHVPAVHMNTQFVVTSKAWFGGGADLTPVLMARRTQEDPDTKSFHAAMAAACAAHTPIAPYERFKTWCDDYFLLRHRGEPRAASEGSFSTGRTAATGRPTLRSPRTWDAPFWASTRSWCAGILQPHGRASSARNSWCGGGDMWSSICSMIGAPSSELKTGGNVESILSSMPPMVKWP